MPPGDRDPSTARKNRGAYYTDPAGAAALCAWAIRRGGDTVLDPSFGTGVFLRAAAARLASLGGSPTQVHGVEVDAAAHAAGTAVAASTGVPDANLARRDFFAVAAAPRFDAVVGNPPFIRFQRFKGPARDRARRTARAAGVELSPLASSWAPFLIHAARCVAPGGRMALVVPRELGQVEYGRDVLAFLAEGFARVTLVASRERWFPQLDQDTYALLAAGRGEPGGDVRLGRIDRPTDLGRETMDLEPLDVDALVRGVRNARFFGLGPALQDRIEAVEAHPLGVRLGAVATVTSGYVTGDNAFFHLSPRAADDRGIGADARIRAVFRSRALTALAFDVGAWRAGVDHGAAGYLFAPGPSPDAASRALIAAGEAAGVHRGYKARHRADWWVVPRVRVPDLLLAAMAADEHALSVNTARAAPANTLHAVTLAPEAAPAPADGRGGVPGPAAALAVAWRTSASRLSRELLGRVLGGGMLKLEPGACARIWIPDPRALDPAEVARAAPQIDALLRAGRDVDAQRMADRYVLRDALGLSAEDVDGLAAAATELREQRRRERSGGMRADDRHPPRS